MGFRFKRLKISPGAKPWFFEPRRFWNRPRSVFFEGNEVRNRGLDRAPTAAFVRRHMPHAFIVHPHDSTFMGLREWLDEHMTDLYAVGDLPTFLAHAVFIYNDDDAFAFRMRWFAKYVKTTGDSEFDELEQMRQSMNFMSEIMHGMIKDRVGLKDIFRING